MLTLPALSPRARCMSLMHRDEGWMTSERVTVGSEQSVTSEHPQCRAGAVRNLESKARASVRDLRQRKSPAVSGRAPREKQFCWSVLSCFHGNLSQKKHRALSEDRALWSNGSVGLKTRAPDYPISLRRTRPPSPIRPVPSRPRVPGSGTGWRILSEKLLKPVALISLSM